MGIKYRDLVRKHSKARGSARAVLNVLADYANDEGVAWPGRTQIASDTGMSERNVTRCLQSLCDQGRLAIEINAVGGRGRVPHYKIWMPEIGKGAPPKGDNQESERVTDCPPLESIKGDKCDTERVTNEQLKGDNLSIKGDKCDNAYIEDNRSEPQIEPHREPQGEKRVHATPPINFGIERPPQRQAQHFVDGIVGQYRKLSLSPKEFTELVNTLLDGMNKRALADLDTRQGISEHTQAQECALALAAGGYRTPQAIAELFVTWKQYDWRGKKGESPSYKSLIDHVAELPSLIAVANQSSSGGNAPNSNSRFPTKTDRKRDAFANVERMLQEKGLAS